MIIKKFTPILLIAGITALGWHVASNKSSPKTLPNRGRLTIVASFYPLYYFSRAIAGEHADVSNITEAHNPHAYRLSPQDRARLQHADLVIFNGLHFETWAEGTVPQLKAMGIPLVNASEGIALPADEDVQHKHHHKDCDCHKHKHHHEKELQQHKDYHEHHHETGVDHHIWLDPVLAQHIVRSISNKLIEIDKKNRATYKANAQKLVQKLKRLDAQYTAHLKHCTADAIVTHNAFGYLAKRYGFRLHPIVGLSSTDEPSAKIIASLKEKAKKEGITYILTEENQIRKYAETIAAETGLHMMPINPIANKKAGKDYFDMAKDNLASLATALQCKLLH